MIRVADGIATELVAPSDLHSTVRRLHAEGYALLVDLFAYDTPDRRERFDVVYLFRRIADSARARVKVQVAEGEPIPSLVALHPGANWYEREAYDLYGVAFSGHPDLRRILLPDDWIGHPLRRDHPLGGEVVEYGLRDQRPRATVAPIEFPEGTRRE